MAGDRRLLLAGVDVGVPDPSATADWLARGFGFHITTDDGAAVAWCAGEHGEGTAQAAIRLVAGEGLIAVRLSARAPFDLTDPCGLRFIAGVARPGPDALPAAPLRPRRLGHVNLRVPDAAASVRFYVDELGMLLSEQIGDELFFLRFGSEHHNIGLRSPGAAALHHLGFELPGWESYRPLLDHLADIGCAVEYGPGRHGPGRNLFTYVREPSSGLRLELFADMSQVGAQDDPGVPLARWGSGDRMTRTINRWGPLPPESFLE